MTAQPDQVTCHLCGDARWERLFEASDRLALTRLRFELRRCASCGLAATWPPAEEAALAAFYPDEYWAESAEPDQAWIDRTQREKTRVVLRHAPRGGRLLDVGCGAGFFLRALRPESWDRWGVEISPRSAAVADRHVGSGRVFAGRLGDARLEAGAFDVVTFWASLEHLVAPRRELAIARALLRPGGLVIVQVPDFGSTQARRFGPDWFALDLPRHRHHFTRETLGRLLAEEGFEPIETLARSETHDRHALKQSLKSRLVGRARLGRLRYYAAAPWLGVVDRIIGGATLTVTSRRA